MYYVCSYLCCVITTVESGDSCSALTYKVFLLLISVPALQLMLGVLLAHLLCMFFFSLKMLTFRIEGR